MVCHGTVLRAERSAKILNGEKTMDKITKCKRDILKLIDSVYLRKYLVGQIDRLSVTDYMEIVMKAPVSLQKKYKLLGFGTDM